MRVIVRALIVIAVCCTTYGKLFSQTYIPPRYTADSASFFNYVSSYARLFDLLPHQKDYVEKYVYTVFISKDGTLKFTNVLGKDLDIRTELKRVIRLCDKWQPAMLNNVAIDTTVTDSIKICSIISEKKSCIDSDSTKTIQYYRNPVGSGTSPGFNSIDRGVSLYNKGRSLFQAKNYTEAISAFEKAIENYYSPYKEPLFNIGVCYLQLSDTSNACKYFLEAARYGDEEAENIYKQRCK